MEPDYIIIGAGSAGSLLAARLSETNANVLLFEAGPETWHPLIHIPAGVRSLHRNPALNWEYTTEPHPDTANRSIHWPRGRVIGGSGSINGMLYVRGNPGDYDCWADMGCPGWSYAEVLPYFKKTERYASGDAHYRGKDGPLPVVEYKAHLNLTHRFVRAAQQAGLPLTEDYNGAQQEGVGYAQMTRLGRFRGSTAFALLRPARSRPNLRVKTNAFVTRLVFEGKQCVGVSYRKGGHETTVRARREVILCGGAINSPHLLMLSGVGPAAELQSLGIPVIHDAPGVGKNLIDHYYGGVTARVKNEISINQLARGWRLVREVLRFLLMGDGALTYGITASTVFTRSRFHAQPTGTDAAGPATVVHTGQLQPRTLWRARSGAWHHRSGVHRPAGEPREPDASVSRSGDTTAHSAKLPFRIQRRARTRGRSAARPPDFRGSRHGAMRGRRNLPGTKSEQRRSHR
jgi:choline dehydrogenase